MSVIQIGGKLWRDTWRYQPHARRFAAKELGTLPVGRVWRRHDSSQTWFKKLFFLLRYTKVAQEHIYKLN